MRTLTSRFTLPVNLVVALLAATLAMACDTADPPEKTQQPLTAEQASEAAALNLESVAEAWSDSSEWMGGSSMSSEISTAMGGGENDPVMGEPQASEAGLFGLGDLVADFAEFLKNEVMTADQVESEDGATVVYLLDPEKVCVSEAIAVSGGAPAVPGEPMPPADEEVITSIDQDCVEMLTAFPIRARVVSFASGEVDVTLLVGEAQIAPATAQLHASLIAVSVDLAVAKQAFEAFVAATDTEVPVEVTQASGILRLVFEKLGPQHVRATAEVAQAVALAGTIEGEALSLEVGVSKAEIEVDGIADTMAFDSTIGPLAATVAYQLVANFAANADDCVSIPTPMDDSDPSPGIADCGSSEPATVSGTLGLHLGGASAHFLLDDPTNAFALTNASLGPATLTLDGQTVASLNLNGGGAVAGTATEVADEMTIQVVPGLEVEVVLELGLLGDVFDGVMGSWAESETLTGSFQGEEPTVVFTDAGAKILEGTLTLQSASHPEYDITIMAGQCLLIDDAPPVSTTVPVPDPGSGGGEPGSGSGDEGTPNVIDDDSSSHPFEGLATGTCSG